jgi:predicted metal-dependent enzyme (double-stranded beta helix superfamily)
MFDVERFVTDCRRALKEPSPELAVKDVVEGAMARPGEVERALGTPHWAEIATLHRADDLTILNVVWAPGMAIYPHDHRMWAVIGLYGGREDNTFYRRGPQGLVRAGGQRLELRDTALLGKNVIHAVANPLPRATGAIHVYGGDFFATPRSEFDPETFEERPYDVENAKRVFREANDRLRLERDQL